MNSRFIRWIDYLCRTMPDQRVDVVAQGLPQINTNRKNFSHHISVQGVADLYYLCIFSLITQQMAARGSLKIDIVLTRSVESGFGNSFKAYLMRSFAYSFFFIRQWINAYAKLGAEVGYRSISWGRPLQDCAAIFKAVFIWRNIKDVEDLERLEIYGVFCGDLIIDTYLRFRPSPKIEIQDIFLLYVIWQAIRDIKRAKFYFEIHKPDIYLTSYSTYVQHGVAVRVALMNGTKVISFGNLQQIGKTLCQEDHFHTKNSENYKRDFQSKDNVVQERLMHIAKQQLEMRLNGGIDMATAYMKQSAYSNVYYGNYPDVTGSAIIFLHDFYDSPHVYPGLIFPEFWTWICFTIDTLIEDKIPFFLKAHPNQVGRSAEVIIELKEKYPQVRFISEGMSNLRLAEGGILCGITVYGTVAHELAYLGIPSIACAQHPHVAFDFCKTARSREEYRNLLGQIMTLSLPDKDRAKMEVLQFYAMHNLNESEEIIEARAAMINLFNSCNRSDSTGASILENVGVLASCNGFEQYAKSIL